MLLSTASKPSLWRLLAREAQPVTRHWHASLLAFATPKTISSSDLRELGINDASLSLSQRRKALLAQATPDSVLSIVLSHPPIERLLGFTLFVVILFRWRDNLPLLFSLPISFLSFLTLSCCPFCFSLFFSKWKIKILNRRMEIHRKCQFKSRTTSSSLQEYNLFFREQSLVQKNISFSDAKRDIRLKFSKPRSLPPRSLSNAPEKWKQWKRFE